MIKTSFAAAQDGRVPDTEAHVDVPGCIRSSAGFAQLTSLAPGERSATAAEIGDAAVVVLEGTVTVRLGGAARAGDNALGQRELARGSVLAVPRDMTVTLSAGADGAQLFCISGAAPEAGPHHRDVDIVDGFAVVPVIAHDPARGFYGMTAAPLINGSSGGTRAFTAATSTFEAGEGCHALHRHNGAEEIFFVWEGAGEHLSVDGESVPVAAGEMTWVATGEWHGFRNTGSSAVRALFCYLGVDDRSLAGYELP